MSSRASRASTTTTQLSQTNRSLEMSSMHNHSNNINHHSNNRNNSGDVTDDPDLDMTSDEENRERNNNVDSDAETIPLEDDVINNNNHNHNNNNNNMYDETEGDDDDDDDTNCDTIDDYTESKKRKIIKKTVKEDGNLLITDGKKSSIKKIGGNGGYYDEDVGGSSNAAPSNRKIEEDGWSKDFDRDTPSPNLDESKKNWEGKCAAIFVVIVLAVVVGVVVYFYTNQSKVESMIDLRFANYFSNHMVLQGSPHKPVIWGYGPKPTDYKNISVIVRLYRFNSSRQSIATKQHTNVLTTETSVKDDSLSKYLAEVEPEYWNTSRVQRAAAGNTWRVTLEPPTNKGPYLITASLIGQSEDQVIKLRDVMFGDVWVCTGHDRGLDRLNKIANFTDNERPTSTYDGEDGDEDDLRIFSVFPAKSDVPWPDVHLYDIPWTIASKSKAPRIRDRSGSYSPIFPGPCWHFGHKLRRHLKRPLGLISAIYNENLPEEWLPSQVLDVSEKTNLESSSRNWNGMIHPLLDVQIRGVIFQQGDVFDDDDRDQKEKEKKEKSKKSSSDYSYFFKEFTRHWRMGVRSRSQPLSSTSGGDDGESNLNNDDTPLISFGIIQALPNNNSQSKPLATASNRWRATANRGYLPNSDLMSTFLAVTIDLPDTEDTRQEQKLGERLYRGALHVTYHEKVDHKGPTPFEYVNVKNRDLTLNFNTNIVIRSDSGFEICCSKTPRNQTCKGPEDKASGFYWDHVIMTSSTDKSVTLNTENCPWHTVGFRYAWSDEPCEFESCSVYSARTNLPMPSFIHLHMLDDGKPKKLHLVSEDF